MTTRILLTCKSSVINYNVCLSRDLYSLWTSCVLVIHIYTQTVELTQIVDLVTEWCLNFINNSTSLMEGQHCMLSGVMATVTVNHTLLTRPSSTVLYSTIRYQDNIILAISSVPCLKLGVSPFYLSMVSTLMAFLFHFYNACVFRYLC